jgi:S-adenosylmethionine hydrolase
LKGTGPLPAIITFLTDFGDRDEYVGVMKGVVLRRAPRAVLIDLCHHIPSHDIRQAAAMIAAAYRYFPEGTLHVMVVDPGVGSDRRIVFAQAASHQFLCPDNGLLSGLITTGKLLSARQVANPALMADDVSATFHGRDVIAPVAGFLASGGRPETLGERLAIETLVCLKDSSPHRKPDGSILGAVVAVDRFGNVVTDIGFGLLTSTHEGDLKQFLTIDIVGSQTLPLVSAYSEGRVGDLLALIGSRQTLEIAVNQGNAAQRLGIRPGMPVQVTWSMP